MRITKEHKGFIRVYNFTQHESIRPYLLFDKRIATLIINIANTKAGSKTIEYSEIKDCIKRIEKLKNKIDNVFESKNIKKFQNLFFKSCIDVNRFSSNSTLWKQSKKDITVLSDAFLDKELQLLRQLYNQI